MDALHRLTALASKDVLMKSSMLEKKIADRMCSEVSKFMENVVNPSATNDADVRNKCDPHIKRGGRLCNYTAFHRYHENHACMKNIFKEILTSFYL